MSAFSELNVWRLHQDGTAAAVAPAGVGAQGGAIVWVDFVPGTDHDALAREFAAMQLPGLDQAMLGFLVETVDPGGYGADRVIWYDAEVAARLSAGGDVRYLHAFALLADVPPGPATPELPMVYRRDVHFLVSDRWVITRRVRGFAVTRGYLEQEREAISFAELSRFAVEHWDDYHEPQDFGTLILRALAATWVPALERITMRLANSELLYVQGPLDDREPLNQRRYRQDLVDLKWIVDGLSSAFASLRRPGVAPTKAWFDTKSAPAETLADEIAALLDLASSELARHPEQVRDSFDLIAATETSRQIELGNEERRRGARLEETITFIATILLVPTLVAGLFAAVPTVFEDCLRLRLALLFGSMALGAVLTYLLLGWLRNRADRDD